VVSEAPNCDVCQKFDSARLQAAQRSSPTLIQVREAGKNGCGACEIINNAITRFDLVQTVIGEDPE
jgi:hypothetical protein